MHLDRFKAKIDKLPTEQQNKIILTVPIGNKNFITFTKCEWMVVLIVNREHVEILGIFKNWAYANISERALAMALSAKRLI